MMAIKEIVDRFVDKIFHNNNSMNDQLIEKTVPISLEMPVQVTIHDNIEGNVTFNFKLVENEFNDSYTKLEVLDANNADIIISNVRGYGVSCRNYKVGTFRGNYDLYLNFAIYPSEGMWLLQYTFLAKPIKK